MAKNATNLVMSDQTYNRLKYLAQIVLPGLATLYASLGDLWNLPQPTKVGATIMAVDLFLGFLLKRSSDQYQASDERFDGELEVDKTEETPKVSLQLDEGPESLENKDEVTVKVNTETTPVPVKVSPKKRAPRKKA